MILKRIKNNKQGVKFVINGCIVNYGETIYIDNDKIASINLDLFDKGDLILEDSDENSENPIITQVSTNEIANKAVTMEKLSDEIVQILSEPSGQVLISPNGTKYQLLVSNDGILSVQSIIAITDIVLDKTTLSIEDGTTAQLTATISPANANNKNVIWSSSNTNIATVNSTGLITTVSAGSAIITVRTIEGNHTATCNLTVTIPVIAATGVALDNTELNLNVSETTQLTATVSPANATNKDITWSSSDTNIATVSSTGLVTAIDEGNVTITATTVDGNYTATCSIVVTTVVVEPTIPNPYWNIKMSTSTIVLDTNNKIQSISDLSGNNRNLSEPNSVARPSLTTFNELKAIQFSNTTKSHIDGVQVTGGSYTKMILMYLEQWGTQDNFNNLMSGQSGCALYFDLSTHRICASNNGQWQVPSSVAVMPVINAWHMIHASYDVSTQTISIYIDGILAMTRTGQPATNDPFACLNSYNHTGSSGNFMKVIEAGMWNVPLNQEQILTEVARVQNEYGFTLGQTIAPVTGITLDKTTLNTKVGTNQQLVATVQGSNKAVIWSSSNNSIATVDALGLVTFISAGTATITVTTVEGSYTATCNVTVTVAESSMPKSYWWIKSNTGINMDINATTKIRSVTDQSGNGRTIEQGNVNWMPVPSELNGLPIIQFCGEDPQITFLNAPFPPNGAYSKMALINLDAWGSSGYLNIMSGTWGNAWYFDGGTHKMASANTRTWQVPDSCPVPSLNSWHLLHAVYNPTTRSIDMYIDGVYATSRTDQDPTPDDGIFINTFNSGASPGNDMKILEAAVWDVALTPEQIASEVTRVQNEYGITLNT